MNNTEREFHNLIVKTLGNVRDNSPTKTNDKYYPARFAKLVGTDETNFRKLYTIKPDAQTGNGEVALFWLWNYHMLVLSLSKWRK